MEAYLEERQVELATRKPPGSGWLDLVPHATTITA